MPWIKSTSCQYDHYDARACTLTRPSSPSSSQQQQQQQQRRSKEIGILLVGNTTIIRNRPPPPPRQTSVVENGGENNQNHNQQDTATRRRNPYQSSYPSSYAPLTSTVTRTVVEFYELATKRWWTLLPSISCGGGGGGGRDSDFEDDRDYSDRTSYDVTSLYDKAWLIGGLSTMENQKVCTSILEFDFSSKSWHTIKTKLYHGRIYPTTICIPSTKTSGGSDDNDNNDNNNTQDRLLVLGGRNEYWEELTSVEEFVRNKDDTDWERPNNTDDGGGGGGGHDYSNNNVTTRTIPNFSVPRMGATAVCYNHDDTIYLIGGYTGTQWTTSVETYNLQQDSWTEDTIRMPKPVAFPQAVLFDDNNNNNNKKKNLKDPLIFVLGNALLDDEDDDEDYDYSQRNSRGNYDYEQQPTILQCYNIRSKTWTIVKNTPSHNNKSSNRNNTNQAPITLLPKEGCAMVGVNHTRTLFAIGGCDAYSTSSKSVLKWKMSSMAEEITTSLPPPFKENAVLLSPSSPSKPANKPEVKRKAAPRPKHYDLETGGHQSDASSLSSVPDEDGGNNDGDGDGIRAATASTKNKYGSSDDDDDDNSQYSIVSTSSLNKSVSFEASSFVSPMTQKSGLTDRMNSTAAAKQQPVTPYSPTPRPMVNVPDINMISQTVLAGGGNGSVASATAAPDKISASTNTMKQPPSQHQQQQPPVITRLVDPILWRDGLGMEGHYMGEVTILDSSRTNIIPHGRGVMQWAMTGHIYDGDWQMGQKSGFGSIAYPNGDDYVGYWRQDVKWGKGTYTWRKDGRKYEGNYIDDKPEDENGRLTWQSGTVFIGNFIQGQRTGLGTIEFLSGVKYVGNFVNGKYDGQGMCTFQDGCIYTGEWKRGTAHGFGQLCDPTGKIIYEGQWINDSPAAS